MKRIMIFVAVLALLSSPVANADTAMISAKVKRVLLTGNGQYGGCMVLLTTSVNASLPNCPGSWVSLSCTGDFSPKDSAYRMLDVAQMAKALNSTIYVFVDDTKKHNGYCYSNRIDIL